MTNDSDSPRSLGAVMSAEAGFEGDDISTPLRPSGFVALIFALIGGFTVVATPMVGFCIAAVLLALFTLRKHESAEPPVGKGVAKVAILAAVLFASWGVGRYTMRQSTLGNQAEYFARQYMRVVCNGDHVYALELRKSYVNRYLKTMPLMERYELEKQKVEETASKSGEQERAAMMEQIEEAEHSSDFLLKYSPDHDWILDRPVRVYSKYGRTKADLVFAADRSAKPFRVMMTLEYMIHKENGSVEWHVDQCSPYRERIVAESIL